MSKPKSSRRTSSSKRSKQSKRTPMVWAAFGAAMTIAASLLVASGGGLRAIPMAVTLNVDTSSGSAPERLDRERWQAIVIHHSGSPGGSPESIDRLHRSAGLQGLGYHFVIGNGIDFGDGALFVGPRWTEQQPGAHVAERPNGTTPDAAWFNRHAIGICLVGNGERRGFTEAQMRRLSSLVAELQRELGISDREVYLHSDLAAVASPGRFFPVAAFEASLGD